MVSIVAGGRITRMELFEPEDVAAALARFEELRPDPLRIPPNAATRAFDRRLEASRAGDWEALEALCAPTLVFDDRRRGLRTMGGRDMFIAHNRHIFSRGARLAHRVLATSGDRLALQHHDWKAADDGPPFEIEALGLIEVDAEGRMVAVIVFDPGDRRAASAELLDRYARSDAARCIPDAVFEAFRAINDRDLDRLRATLHADLVYHDHRRTGIGRLERVDDYVASIRPLYEGAPEFFTDNLYYVAAENHGSLAIARTFGTLAEGGEFESIFARLLLYRDGRISAVEQFELEHLDAARARFEALRPKASASTSSDRAGRR
jgi:ketosteroid isomerase-like protein